MLRMIILMGQDDGSWLKAHGSWPRGAGPGPGAQGGGPVRPGPAAPLGSGVGPAPLGHEPWAMSLEPWAMNHEPSSWPIRMIILSIRMIILIILSIKMIIPIILAHLGWSSQWFIQCLATDNFRNRPKADNKQHDPCPRRLAGNARLRNTKTCFVMSDSLKSNIRRAFHHIAKNSSYRYFWHNWTSSNRHLSKVNVAAKAATLFVLMQLFWEISKLNYHL